MAAVVSLAAVKKLKKGPRVAQLASLAQQNCAVVSNLTSPVPRKDDREKDNGASFMDLTRPERVLGRRDHTDDKAKPRLFRKSVGKYKSSCSVQRRKFQNSVLCQKSSGSGNMLMLAAAAAAAVLKAMSFLLNSPSLHLPLYLRGRTC